MADVSIANLPPLVAATPPAASLVPFTDTTDHIESPQGTTKHMTVAQLFTSPPISGSLTLTNLTLTGNLIVQGTTNLQGPVTLDSTLTVAGQVTAPYYVATAGTPVVPANTTIMDQAGVGQGRILSVGSAGVKGTLRFSVTDTAPSVIDALTIAPTGAVTMSQTLTVAGATTVHGSLNVDTRINVGSAGSGTGGLIAYVRDTGTVAWYAGILGSPGETTYSIYNAALGAAALSFNAVTNDATMSGSLLINNSSLDIVANPGTGRVTTRYGSTGGNLYVGLDSSTGTNFATAGAYGTVIYRPVATGFAISRGSTVDLSISSTGAVLIPGAMQLNAGATINGNQVAVQWQAGAVITQIYADSTNLRTIMGNVSSHDVLFTRGGATRLQLTASGITLPTYGSGGGAVDFGAADSGGAGFRVLRVPN